MYKLTLKYSNKQLREYQIKEVEYSLENFNPIIYDISDMRKRNAFHAFSLKRGIYAFIRDHCEPYRLYIGYSENLERRLTEQKHDRKWAGRVIIFELYGFVERETLRMVEDRILRHGSLKLPVLWDNILGISNDAQSGDDNTVYQDPLRRLSFEVIMSIEPHVADPVTKSHLHRSPTMMFDDKDGSFCAMAYTSGGWTFILKGSWINTKFQTYDDLLISRNVSSKFGRRFFMEGKILKRKKTSFRPKGFYIYETLRFRTKAEAALFISGDQADGPWRRIS